MYSKIYTEDIKIVKAFINECRKSLKGLEKEILKLEVHLDDQEILKSMMEGIRRIKREASFLGLVGIIRVAYEMEYIIDAIKSSKVDVNTELIDSLLLCLDFLQTYTKRLSKELKVINLSDGNKEEYLEFSNSNVEDEMLENIKQARKMCEEKNQNISIEKEEIENEHSCWDELLTEEFKNELSTEVREQFLIETSEHLEKIENELLIQLDNDSSDKEALNQLFRAVHSIKGGTGVYLTTLTPDNQVYEGLTKFQELVHTFESLLSVIRDKGYSFEKDIVDLSLLVIDELKSFLNALQEDKMVDMNRSIIDKINQEIQNIQALPGEIAKSTTQPVLRQEGKERDGNSKGSVAQSIRVNQNKIDNMMNMISELIIAKNSFAHISDKLNMEYNLPEISKEVKQVGTYVNRISEELQNAIMSIRMVEIKTVFQKMPRVIRDIAQSTGKKMELMMEGENTEIDKSIIEQISDPLVHIIRNSADHGIEPLEERIKKGKAETGRIVLRAYNKNKYVFIEIEDDGKGIDAEQIKNKAIEKGIISESEAEKMNQTQLINLIFMPGFSMAKQITEVSGRGVGMDIVKSNISKISGSITIESEVNKGTKMIIRLPLSLAVSRGLIIEVAGESYIIPLENIVETVKINRNNIHKYKDKYFTYLRGTAIGMEWLSKIFSLGERDADIEELNAVILTNGVENYAVVVDKLRNEQEFVVKTLDGHLSSISGIAGSTLLGNGQVVLIIDPIDLFKLVGM